jgi:DNA-binding NarL/FixJ family response regulator
MSAVSASTTIYTVRAGRKVSMPNKPIKVLIIDDYAEGRASIRKLLSAAKDIVIIGEGGSGREAIEQVATKNPDILLLDMELPDQRGDIVMRHIHEMQPDTKVLALSSYNDRDYILNMIQHGAAGYITKDEAPTMLIDAIRNIINQSGSWFSPQAVKNSSLTPLEQQALSKREVQILQQLTRDRSVDEIAAAVGISKKLVEEYLALLMKKFETEALDALKQIAHRILSRRTF